MERAGNQDGVLAEDRWNAMAKLAKDHGSQQFQDADLARIVRSTFVQRVDFNRELASTNNRALELAGKAEGLFPWLVLADRQTAGRGRGANRWWSGDGALTFSLLLETSAALLPPRRWPRVSLTAALAVCEAIERLVGDRATRVKWPNDVYLEERKVCGILVELPPARQGMMVLGIGINVNNSMQSAPRELQSSAITLSDVAQRKFPLVDVLECVLESLAERLQWMGCGNEDLQASWRERCLLTHRHVHIDCGSRVLQGTCRGIDEDGALILETASGVERCFAGVVTQF